MESIRKIKKREEDFLRFLINKSKRTFLKWDISLRVKTLNNSVMGSLLLIPKGIISKKDSPIIGDMISECSFKDKDNVTVLATLYVDEKGNLFC
ncbi:MAG: DUF6984 family protein [Polaribacter sp.]